MKTIMQAQGSLPDVRLNVHLCPPKACYGITYVYGLAYTCTLLCLNTGSQWTLTYKKHKAV